MARPAHAQCQLARLVHADRQIGDALGGSMDLDDGSGSPLLAVGMQADSTGAAIATGSVRFFTGGVNGQWAESPLLSLTPNDAQPNDYFGNSVAYDHPYVIVGAVGVGSTGAAYIYRRSGAGWVKEAKVVPPGSQFGDNAGSAVAIQGEFAMVGSPWADFDGSPAPGVSDPTSGMVTAYKRQPDGTWAYIQTLRDAFPGITAGQAANARYGSALDMRGFIAVIGVPYGQIAGLPPYHGYVRILRLNNTFSGWVDDGLGRLTSPLVQSQDRFGAAVSTSGDAIAVGAPDDDAETGELGPSASGKADSGAVYFYRYTANGWIEDGRVIPPDASDNAHFGGAVAMGFGGVRCMVAAPGAKKAYVYRRVAAAQWALESTIRDPDSPSAFASGLAYDGAHAVVGDWSDSGGGVANGGALFAITPAQEYGDSCDDAPQIPSFGGSVTGCTTFAQADGGTNCGLSLAVDGPDVWVSFVPSCTGPVTLSTLESGYDTVLSVHDGCPEPGDTHTLMCNDDFGGHLQSQLTFSASAGSRYLIRVGGFAGDSGFFVLMTDFSTPANDWCTSPIAVSGGNSYTFQNCGAATDGPTAVGGPSPCLDHMSNDIWFRFFSPSVGTLKLSTCGSSFDTMLSVYAGATCPGGIVTELACNDDAAPGATCSNPAPADGTSALAIGTLPAFPYTIRVGGFDLTDPTGDGVLNVEFIPNCGCDWNQSGALSVQDIFDFLAAYFSGSADFNHSGSTTVQDIFDFLACYFGGCP